MMENKDITIKRYKKQHALFMNIGAIYLVVALTYVVITILNSETFDTKAIIACSIFAGSTVVFMIMFTVFDTKRNNIIRKYYGEVSKADQEKAQSLLEKMSVVDKNEYDFFDVLHYDDEDVAISQALKLLAKGKKIYIGLYQDIKSIEQEIIANKDKYTDEEFNNFIFELVPLLENNCCDI